MQIKHILTMTSCAVLATACATNDTDSEIETTIDNLVNAGFPHTDIRVNDGQVYVGRDAVVTLEASQEMLEAPASGKEQYRTNNLVSRGVRTVCIRVNPAPDITDEARLNTLASGGNLAIANYNELGLTFTLSGRGATDSTADCNAVIQLFVVNGPGGGVAGFPSGGLPFGSMQIQLGTADFGVNVVAHVVTHELGHTLGLRHTDFFNRAISCGGSPVNEGDAGVGAIYIPGTSPSATFLGSVMNSCFNGFESGDFAPDDITALRTFYGL